MAVIARRDFFADTAVIEFRFIGALRFSNGQIPEWTDA